MVKKLTLTLVGVLVAVAVVAPAVSAQEVTFYQPKCFRAPCGGQ